MRILFVAGTVTGGSARSTHELAARLQRRGHDVGVLARRKPARRVNPDGAASSSLFRLPGRGWSACRRQATRRAGLVRDEPYPQWVTGFLERTAPPVLHEFAQVVVVNSVYRRAWDVIHRESRAIGVPLVLYQREHGIVEQLSAWETRPDLLVTNAETHAREAAQWQLDGVVIPSIVDIHDCRIESCRERVLFVNPVVSRGLDTALALASLRPDVPFVFQESWPLVGRDRRALVRTTAPLGNVEVRPFAPDISSVYRDARVLFAPYEGDNRPRVVLEAQANGIPVLAADCEGLREAVGAGGVFVSRAAPIDEWGAALAALWDDPATYGEYVQRATQHTRRPDVDPEHLTARFEAVILELCAETQASAPRA